MPPRGWKREYEINFSVPEGAPVYPECEAGIHVREVNVVPGARLLRFWDFGNVCPVTLYSQLDVWGRLLVLDETVLQYTALDGHCAVTLAKSADLMGGSAYRVWDAGDPEAEHEMELGQISRELLRRGILLQTMRSSKGGEYALRQRFLGRTMVNGHQSPMILIHPKCVTLIRAATGAFHYKPNGKVSEEHPWKDVMDALKYGVDNLTGTREDHATTMRRMATIDQAW